MVRKSKLNTRIRDLAVIVKDIMTAHTKARDDDFLLYAYVLNYYGYSKDTSFWEIRTLVQQTLIPSMESVGRARRKAQELYPELRASKVVEDARLENTAEYIDFAQDGSI